MNNARVEAAEALKIRIQLWPVLMRETTEYGALKRSRQSYKRTKVPTLDREVEVVDIPSSTRVSVYFDLCEHMVFSVKTGRCVGRQDWIIAAESLKSLRDFFATNEMKAAKAIDDCFMALLPQPEEDDEPMVVPASPMNDVSG